VPPARNREPVEETPQSDVYKIRGWGIFGLVLKFATTRMDRWPGVAGVDSLFDNTPLYNRYVREYFRHGHDKSTAHRG